VLEHGDDKKMSDVRDKNQFFARIEDSPPSEKKNVQGIIGLGPNSSNYFKTFIQNLKSQNLIKNERFAFDLRDPRKAV